MDYLATEFNGRLAESFKSGQYFDIDVKATDNPKSIHVSLADDKLNRNPAADIGLHVELRFGEHELAVNSRFGDEWREATVVQWPASTLAKDTLKINIQMWDTCFKISLNGDTQLNFYYSAGIVGHLNAIQVGGDVKLITRIDHRQIFPSVWPPSASIGYMQAEQYFSNDIPIKFKPGHLMVLTGRCFGSATGEVFFVLKHSHSEKQILHLNCSFKSKTVYLSNLYPTKADLIAFTHAAPEMPTHFPFDFGKSFKIGIACKEGEFIVAVNGQYYCKYAYRDPPNINFGQTVDRPYKDLLSNIVSIKVQCRYGTGFKVTALDHIQLHDPQCANIEKYTANDCQCSDLPCDAAKQH